MVRPEFGRAHRVDIFDEINEDLRAERAQALLKRYGAAFAGLLVLALVGFGAWQFWRSRQAAQNGEVAGLFMAAVRKATPTLPGLPLPDGERAEALSSFQSLANTAPPGYRTLSRLRAATLQIGGGNRDAGLALLDRVSADTAADPLLRGLADLLWVEAQVDAGDPAAVEGRLAALLVPGGAWRSLGREQQALLLLRTGKEGAARDVLRQLVADAAAPVGARTRAASLLARIAEVPQAPASAPAPSPAPASAPASGNGG